MKIKPTPELKELSKIFGVPYKTLSRRIIKNLLKNDCIENSPEHYGLQMAEILGFPFLSVQEIANLVLFGKQSGRVTRLAMYHFERLVILGPGNCPECGGDLIETATGEVRQKEAATQWTPADIEFCKVDKCDVCDFENNKRFE